MEIAELFYIKDLSTDVILSIYSHLVQCKGITLLQKNEIINSVNLLNVLRESFNNNHISINNPFKHNLYLYNQLLLYFKCKSTYSINEFLSRFQVIQKIYKNCVFYIDIHKNKLNESELKRKIHNIWYKKLNDNDRYLFASFITPDFLFSTTSRATSENNA